MDRVDISSLSDDELWRRTARLAAQERACTADLVEHLGEIDVRGLSERRNYGSLYEYCVNTLRFSEGAAYKRIRAARAIRRFPTILDMLRDGRLSLAAVSMLHPHLEEPDAASLIVRACGLRVRKLEALLSVRRPQDVRREVVRFVGSAPAVAPAPPSEGLPFDMVVDTVSPMFAGAVPPPPPSPVITPPGPPSPRLVRFAFTADEEFYLLLERVRALMRHKYPDGRLEGVLRDALRALLERKDPLIRWGMARRRRSRTRAARA